MTTEKLDSTTTGFGIAAAVAIIFNTALALYKDTHPDFQAAMKALTGHHWITHGIAVAALFVVLGWLLSKTRVRLGGGAMATLLTLSVLVGAGGLMGWFFFA